MASSGCHFVMVLSTIVGYSLVAMVTDFLSSHDSREHGIQCMPCFFRIISEILPEIHTIEKFDFLTSIIHSHTILIKILRYKSVSFR